MIHISKVSIENFKCFEGNFTLSLNKGLNIFVGDNEVGKSTILEAINLALSGWIYGKYLGSELTQALFNTYSVAEYIESLTTSSPLSPPALVIELFFEIEDDSIKALFEGTGNTTNASACGIQFRIAFDERYKAEYETLMSSSEKPKSLPIEFYEYSWSSFARDDRITPKTIPIKSSFIDSSSTRSQSGSDVYISRIIRDLLTDEQKAKVSQAHRNLKDAFAAHDSVLEINKELSQKEISDKDVKLSVDISTKSAWETSLTTYLDDIPFSNIGRGEQSMIKTKLAMSHKKSQEANVILFEEPENHLSHSKLNNLIKHISSNHLEKQILVSTHSSFVANKLGLGNLILLSNDLATDKRSEVRITNLDEQTKNYFEKLSGFDTLRLVLCKKAILVEGPSDELILQKAYRTLNEDALPIEHEVDIISVGTASLRFLEIAEKLKKLVVVVADNDGDYANIISKKYKAYENCPTIKICADKDETLNTLEPQFVDANKSQLDLLRKVLNITKENCPTQESISEYMQKHKTDCALLIFDSSEKLLFPQYILDAIS